MRLTIGQGRLSRSRAEVLGEAAVIHKPAEASDLSSGCPGFLEEPARSEDAGF